MTAPTTPPKEAAFFTTIRSWGIMRGERGFLGGVIAGLADRLGMSLAAARVIFLVAALFLNGLALLAYAAAWGLLPDRRGNIILQNFGRGMPNVGALIGIGVFALMGLVDLGDSGPAFNLGETSTDWPLFNVAIAIMFVLVPLALVAGVIALIVMVIKRNNANVAQAGVHGVANPGPFATPPGGPVPAAAAASATTAAAATASGAAPAADASGAAVPPAPVAPPVPVVPPAPREWVPGPGKSFYLLTFAWIVISTALITWMSRADQLAVHPLVAWGALFITGFGVILMLVSFSGRKLGFLGFLGIVSLLPTGIVLANAQEIRDSGLGHLDYNIDFAQEPQAAQISQVADPTSLFADDYSEVLVTGWCDDSTIDPEMYGGSIARIKLDEVTEDTTVDVTAGLTYITVPAGTSIVVSGTGYTTVTLNWPSLSLNCTSDSTGGDHLRLVEAGEPVLNLAVADDEYANIIVFEEASK